MAKMMWGLFLPWISFFRKSDSTAETTRSKSKVLDQQGASVVLHNWLVSSGWCDWERCDIFGISSALAVKKIDYGERKRLPFAVSLTSRSTCVLQESRLWLICVTVCFWKKISLLPDRHLAWLILGAC